MGEQIGKNIRKLKKVGATLKHKWMGIREEDIKKDLWEKEKGNTKPSIMMWSWGMMKKPHQWHNVTCTIGVRFGHVNGPKDV